MQPGYTNVLSGDEFADTRFGNNNPYCQDNEISWLDWSLLSKNQALFAFFQYMIAFRKQHPSIRRDLEPSYTSYPSMSSHRLTPEPPVPSSDSHTACVMFSGFDEKTGQEDLVFLAVNAHWIAKQLVLPFLPNGYVWKIAVNTGTCCIRHFRERYADCRTDCFAGRAICYRICRHETSRDSLSMRLSLPGFILNFNLPLQRLLLLYP